MHNKSTSEIQKPSKYSCNPRQVKFYFREVSVEDTQKEILKLDNKKASPISDISTKIIKENADIFAEYLCCSINGSIKSSAFLSCLKVADIIPIHKKGKTDYERKLKTSQHSTRFIKNI